MPEQPAADAEAANQADVGGDPPCWAHLTSELAGLDGRTAAQLLHDLADAVIVADAAGFIVYWNTAAERVFGWTADQAIGEPLELIIPERQRNAHREGYQRVMASGETRYGDRLLRVPSLHADGHRRSIAFTVTLLKGPTGAVSGIAAVVRDETERWTEEQALRRRLRDSPER